MAQYLGAESGRPTQVYTDNTSVYDLWENDLDRKRGAQIPIEPRSSEGRHSYLVDDGRWRDTTTPTSNFTEASSLAEV